MRLVVVTPAPPGSLQGNRITALRYARLLRSLGHTVRVLTRWSGEACDGLIALHARKSHASIERFARERPGSLLCVVLAGTDLYVDRLRDVRVRESLARAGVLVALQERSRARLPAPARRKCRVIPQSARRSARSPRRDTRVFEVVQLGHLRAVKDPLRAALALRGLPAASRLVLQLAGRALDPRLAARARREMRRNPRFRWLGERSHARAEALLARARVFVLPSRSEGGSAALAEALVHGLPVLASRIDANVGMLGARHPGLFAVGDTRALRALLLRCERDARFLALLARASRRRAARFSEPREREAWRRLLAAAARAPKKRPPRSP